LIRIAVEIIIELRENVLPAPEGDDETVPVSIFFSSEDVGLAVSQNDDSRSDAGSANLQQNRLLRHRKEYRDMTVEERAIADVIDLRCLIICIALLERVHGVGPTIILSLPCLERSLEFRGQFYPRRHSDGLDYSIREAEGARSSGEGPHQPWLMLSNRQGLFILQD